MVIRRLDHPGLAARLAPLTGATPRPAAPGAVLAGGPAGYGAPGIPAGPGVPAGPGRLAAAGTLAIPAGSDPAVVFPAAQVPPAEPPPGRDPRLTGPGEEAAGPAGPHAPLISAATLCNLGHDEFALAVKGPVRRVVPVGRFVSGGPR